MNWYYYPEQHKKGDPPIGPFSLDQIVSMIREGHLNETTFVVREEPEECHAAWLFPEISERLQPDIEKIADTYLHGCNFSQWPDDDWWAGDRATDMVLFRPDLGWTLILAMVKKASSDHELWYVATGLLECLLNNHGPKYIDAVEQKASSDSRFKQCLCGVDRVSSDETIWERVKKVCTDPHPS